MDETAAELRSLQALIADGHGAMSAPEFVAFWGAGRPAAISTIPTAGSAPPTRVDVWLAHGRFYARLGPHSHLAKPTDHPRCLLTTGNDAYQTAIVIGTIRRIGHDTPGGSRVAEGAPRWLPDLGVDAVILPQRIYASRPIDRSGRHDGAAARPSGAPAAHSDEGDRPSQRAHQHVS